MLQLKQIKIQIYVDVFAIDFGQRLRLFSATIFNIARSHVIMRNRIHTPVPSCSLFPDKSLAPYLGV